MKVIISLILILSLVVNALASDSFTIKVSCTIPEIPGINAPPFKEEIKSQSIIKQKTESEQEINLLQEEIIEVTEEESSLKVITLYSR